MTKPSVLTLVAVLGTVLLLAVWLMTAHLARDQPNRGVAMDDLMALYPEPAKPLGIIVVKTYREYRGNSIRWSAAYFGCLFGSALLSAMAGLLLKLEVLGSHPKIRNDLAAAFATSAALLVTLSTTGDFQRKWQANRAAAAAMENLAFELVRPAATTNLDAILTRIQTINDARNRGIIGELAEPAPAGGPVPPDPARSSDAEGAPNSSAP